MTGCTSSVLKELKRREEDRERGRRWCERERERERKAGGCFMVLQSFGQADSFLLTQAINLDHSGSYSYMYVSTNNVIG